jgi:chromosome partitioning protein
MKIILIGGAKGGPGKSTIATNLSVMSCYMTKKTLLIDIDSKGSTTSSEFINERHDKQLKFTPNCIQLSGRYINKEIEDFSNQFDVIVIDAGGYDSVELRSAMLCELVKEVFIPVRPGKADIGTLSKMDEVIEKAKCINENMIGKIILNQCRSVGKQLALHNSISAIEKLEYMEVLKTRIFNRISFEHALEDSLIVIESEKKDMKAMKKYQLDRYIPKASQEMKELYFEIINEEFFIEESL